MAALPKAPSKYNPYKYPEVAKFRRNLVLKNLEENNFLTKKEFNKIKESDLNLKKRKIEIVNEANSYTEEVRRSVKENYGFEKLYSQGLSIRTPLDINYQIHALNSLRKGIEEYDKRHGWRGPIANKNKDKNWKTKIEKLKLDPTLRWQLAEIIELNNDKIKFKIIDSKKNKDVFGILNYNNIKWTIPSNKTIVDRHNVADIIFVKK